MMCHYSLVTLMYAIWVPISFLLGQVSAQQFVDTTLDVNYPGLSSACVDTLNSVVKCPSFLADAAIDNNYQSPQHLSMLCVDECKESLDSVRASIENACTASGDVIVESGIAYPATWVVDHFIYTYNISCLTDPATGEFCDTLIQSWANSTDQTSKHSCSDCMLQMQQAELNSPFGYDDDLAEQYASTTSSCGSTGYAFTTPPPYALNATATQATSTTATSSAIPTSECANPYAVAGDDTCRSIAVAQNVSSFLLAYDNNLNIYCSDLIPGRTLCLPDTCDTYIVKPDDSCVGITRTVPEDITVTQLQTWNPNINLLCGNLNNLVDSVICVSPPGGWLGTSNTASPSTATTAVPEPTNAAPGTNNLCASYYTVQQGDYCASVTVQMGISLDDFHFLNPEIDANCTNLILGYAYCVQAVGDITRYANYTGGSGAEVDCLGPDAPRSCFRDVSGFPTVSLLPTDYIFPKYNRTKTATYSIPTETPYPTAPGTISGCYKYKNYKKINSTIPNAEVLVNRCTFVASRYDTSISDLVAWNPSLDSNETVCGLQPGYSYCVQTTSDTDSSESSTSSPPSYCITVSDSEIVEGTTSTCTCYATVRGWDADVYNCDLLIKDYSLTLTQLVAWNPWLDGDCTTNLFANLVNDTDRAVCVNGNSNSEPSSTTSSPTSTSLSSAAAPTQTGVTPSCTEFYTVQSGDGCAAIEAEYDITFAQLYAWNPAIGDDCQYLMVGYAICVGVDSPTTTTSTSISKPTQSSSPCSKHYTVASGDSCAAIESQFGISFAQLYSWNPDIGSNCEYLVVGKTYCVAGTEPVTSAPTPTSRGTATTTAGSAPTQAGITSSCKTFHTAVDGDGCWAIETAYGITADQFISWNPAVGSDCSGLWLGYAYCVGV